jgi:acyl transferase domain-containing protein
MAEMKQEIAGVLTRYRPDPSNEKLAVIGMTCRYPGGCDSPQALWSYLSAGCCAIGPVPPARFRIEEYPSGLIYTDQGAFISGIELFDAALFNISPREAHGIDPQQRLLLELSWEAIERSNQVINRERNNIGLFVGLSSDDYSRINFNPYALEHINAYNTLGTARSVAAGRVAYHLSLHGPVVQIDTACSSSLSAVHLACQSLTTGECDMALAAGVNVILSAQSYISLCRLHALSAHGVPRAFDDQADGYVRGEGCGVVVLKRLRDAELANDNILAVVSSSAMNHDGASNGLTAPNGRAQVSLLTRALARAGIEAGQIGYIEAHGSGTRLGDPIEIGAIREALDGRDNSKPLLLGSVKNNLGHLEAAAGIAGFQKLVLCLAHQAIPPHINVTLPNRFVDWPACGLRLAAQSQHWESPYGKLYGGVSSFGLSGTNVHVILEQYAGSTPRVAKTPGEAGERSFHLWTLSDRSPERLQRRVAQLAELALEASCADIGYTLNTRREHEPHRAALVVSSTSQGLLALAGGQYAQSDVSDLERKPLVFLFTGQGSQYGGMGADLYASSPTFRKLVESCLKCMEPVLASTVREILTTQPADSRIDQTQFTQPCLFVLEYCLAKLWERWGVTPDIVMGHSIGEIVAATVAGALPLEGAIRLVCARAQLMQDIDEPGGMLSAECSEQKIMALLAGQSWQVDLAGVNGPAQVVLSGRTADLDELDMFLSSQGIATRCLNVSHAFHSRVLDPVLAPFRESARSVGAKTPKISLLSTLSARRVAGPPDADHWVRQLREPVRFWPAICQLLDAKVCTFLEIGPAPVLTALGLQHENAGDSQWLVSMRRGQESWKILLEALCRLYLQGVRIDWLAFDVDYARRPVELPGHSPVRQRFWSEAGPPTIPAPVLL